MATQIDDNQYYMWIRQALLLTTLLTVGSLSRAAAPSCLELFSRTAAGDFSQALDAMESRDPQTRRQTHSLIHRAVLAISADPSARAQIPSFMNELRALRDRNRGGDYDLSLEAQNVAELLLLVNAGPNEWLQVLKNDDTMASLSAFGVPSTMGFLLERLSPAQKDELLLKLGTSYAEYKDPLLLKPIHVLLDPLSLYRQMTAQGASGLDFYRAYLAEIKRRVFPDVKMAGYSPETVFGVVRAVQSYMQARDFLHRYVVNNTPIESAILIGSVPNGFARPRSDLDLFNVPIIDHYPELQNQTSAQGDPFAPLRFQIDDPGLQQGINKALLNTPWLWQMENTGKTVREDFGGEKHVFTIFITPDHAAVRFYYQRLDVDEDGNDLPPLPYIEFPL